jgi:hypothetical protein
MPRREVVEVLKMRDADEKTVEAIVDYLRHVASGYALMRSVRANGAKDALYGVADKLEKNGREVLGPRLPSSQSSDGETEAMKIEVECRSCEARHLVKTLERTLRCCPMRGGRRWLIAQVQDEKGDRYFIVT